MTSVASICGVTAARRPPTLRHRPALVPGPAGTVYAINADGQARAFSDTDPAAAGFAGITPHSDPRWGKPPDPARRFVTSGPDAAEPGDRPCLWTMDLTAVRLHWRRHGDAWHADARLPDGTLDRTYLVRRSDNGRGWDASWTSPEMPTEAEYAQMEREGHRGTADAARLRAAAWHAARTRQLQNEQPA